jgi:hypothetical protein
MTKHEYNAFCASNRRADLAAAGSCINGQHHAKPTHGKKCDWCHLVHRVGLLGALRVEALGQAPPRPAGYVPRMRGQ